MKKLFLLYLLWIPLGLVAQAPNWVNASQRELLYPENQYFVKHYSDVNNNKESEGQFLDKLLNAARTELVNSIYSTVQSNTELNIESTNNNQNIETTERLSSISNVYSKITLVGLKSEKYYDKKSKSGHALVYADKSNLIRFYQESRSKTQNAINQNIQEAQSYVSQDNKKEAFKAYYACLQLFKDHQEIEQILLALNPSGFSSEASNLNRAKTTVNTGIHAIKSSPSLNLDEASFLLVFESLARLDSTFQQVNVYRFTYRDTQMLSDFSPQLKTQVEKNISENTRFNYKSISPNAESFTSKDFPLIEGQFQEDGQFVRIISTIAKNTSGEVLSKSEVRLPYSWFQNNQVKYIPASLEKINLLKKLKLEALNPKYEVKINQLAKTPLRVSAYYDEQGQKRPVSNLPLQLTLLANEQVLAKNNTNDLGFGDLFIKNIGPSNNVQVAKVELDVAKYLSLKTSDEYYQKLLKENLIPNARFFLRITGSTAYIESNESNLGVKSDIPQVSSKLKEKLSEYAFNFTPDYTGADFYISIKAQTRQGNIVSGLHFSYADVSVSITDLQTGKELYKDSFSNIKGGGNSFALASRKALDKAAEKVIEAVLNSMNL